MHRYMTISCMTFSGCLHMMGLLYEALTSTVTLPCTAHRTHSAPQGMMKERWPLSRSERAALPREAEAALAWTGRQAEEKAQHIKQHTWLARFGSLKPSKVVPLAFAVFRLDVVTSLASLISGTNSTPEGTVSPCMHDECALIGQGPHQEHRHVLLRKPAIIAAPLLCFKAIVGYPPEYQERLPSHTPMSHSHPSELWPAH